MALQNNKSLGQHWLKDREILDEIAEASITDIEELPLCLEIGPGLGTLTSSLLRIYPKVLAVEFDARLAGNLPKSFPGKNLEVVNEDFLKFDLSSLPEYVVCANIPYYITSPIITKLLEAENLPRRIVLLVQKEVAERIAEGDNQLGLFVKNRAEVSLGAVVAKEYFTPPPKVDSQVLILNPHRPTLSSEVFDLIGLGFMAPRKKLMKSLAGKTFRGKALQKVELEPIFNDLGISLDVRPGDLTLEKWGELYRALV